MNVNLCYYSEALICILQADIFFQKKYRLIFAFNVSTDSGNIYGSNVGHHCACGADGLVPNCGCPLSDEGMRHVFLKVSLAIYDHSAVRFHKISMAILDDVSRPKKCHRIIESPPKSEKKNPTHSNVSFSTVPTDVLALTRARTSAGTVLTVIWVPYIYIYIYARLAHKGWFIIIFIFRWCYVYANTSDNIPWNVTKSYRLKIYQVSVLTQQSAHFPMKCGQFCNET